MPLDLADFDKIDRIVRASVHDEVRSALDGTEPVPLARKWEGGRLELWPREEGLAAKELPLETFFHKIVLIRDRLRTLEQQINAHERLSDADKVHLQQYITRCYGSLTTFNVLFKDKDDQFSGSGE
jgi:hypothetical protein